MAAFVAPATASAEYAIKAGSNVNVRTGPGTGYSAIGTIPAGQIYAASAKSGDWWKICFDGRYGYTNAPFWSGVSGQTGVKITADKLNVRSGPGTSYSALGSVYMGQIYYWVALSNGWYKINWGGRTGYVLGSYVTRVSLAAGGSTTTTTTTTTTSTTRTNLNMLWYRQVNDYFCGPTSAQIIIRYISGRYYDQWTINRIVGANSWSGSNTPDIVRGVRYFSGQTYYTVYNFNRSRVITNINRNVPVQINFLTRYIAYTGYQNFMHHSVIKGYTSGGFYIHDTAWGPNKWASTTQVTNAVNYHYRIYAVRY